MPLLVPAAWATTVAVIDLVGVDVPSADLGVAAEGVRSALLAEGDLDPISGADIADGVSHGLDDTLRTARSSLDEARRLYADGDSLTARDRLFEARKRFVKARSDVGRRAELADAWFVDGLCALDLGDAVRAREDFAEALRLVPDYDTTRISKVPTAALPLLSAARDQVRAKPPGLPTGDSVATIASLLDADYVATGRLSADGTVSIQVYTADGTRIGRVEAHAADVPVDAGDPAWRVLAQGIANRVEAATPATTAPPPEDVQVEDEPVSEQRSLVQRWWFWAGVVAILGGGAAGLAVALQPAPVEEQSSAASYDVTVELPD